jgi:hypothetical protein
LSKNKKLTRALIKKVNSLTPDEVKEIRGLIDEDKPISIIRTGDKEVELKERLDIPDTAFFLNEITNELMGNCGTIINREFILEHGTKISNEVMFSKQGKDYIKITEQFIEFWVVGNFYLSWNKMYEQVDMLKDVKSGAILFISEEFRSVGANEKEFASKEHKRRNRNKRKLRRFKRR